MFNYKLIKRIKSAATLDEFDGYADNYATETVTETATETSTQTLTENIN